MKLRVTVQTMNHEYSQRHYGETEQPQALFALPVGMMRSGNSYDPVRQKHFTHGQQSNRREHQQERSKYQMKRKITSARPAAWALKRKRRPSVLHIPEEHRRKEHRADDRSKKRLRAE